MDNVLIDLAVLPLPQLGELQPALHAILPLHPSHRHRLRPPIILAPRRRRHLRLVDAMRMPSRPRRASARTPRCTSLAHALLALLARTAALAGELPGVRRYDTAPAAVERVRRHLHGQPTAASSLSGMARLAGCAAQERSRARFRRYTGLSVVGYRHRL